MTDSTCKNLRSQTLFKVEKGMKAVIEEKVEELNSSSLLTPNNALIK